MWILLWKTDFNIVIEGFCYCNWRILLLLAWIQKFRFRLWKINSKTDSRWSFSTTKRCFKNHFLITYQKKGIFIIISITSQNKLVSPYHGSSAELVLIGVEPGTLRFRVDVIYGSTTCHVSFNDYIYFIKTRFNEYWWWLDNCSF